MAAPLGNKFWLARSSHGRNPIFKNPNELWIAACEYFEWVQANPLYEDKVNFHQGQAVHESVPKMRAMTIQALTFFLIYPMIHGLIIVPIKILSESQHKLRKLSILRSLRARLPICSMLILLRES